MKDLKVKIITALYLLSAIPLLGFSAYEIFRVKSNHSPMDASGTIIFLILTLSYCIWIEKRKKQQQESIKEQENN